ncbi:MAG: hypothetical protein ACRCXC_13575 [Legionella sp.]
MSSYTFLANTEDDLATRVVLDGIREKQDKLVAERNGREDAAVKNHLLVQKIKATACDLFLLTKQVDELVTTAEVIPAEVSQINEKLKLFAEKHKKVFAACHNEKELRSYNDFDVKAMIADLKELRKEIRSLYASLHNSQFDELYERFSELSKQIINADGEKASKMFFQEKGVDARVDKTPQVVVDVQVKIN